MSATTFPVGSRVRVVGAPEWVGGRELIGAVGTVTGHDTVCSLGCLIVEIADGSGAAGVWMLTDDEVEPAEACP